MITKQLWKFNYKGGNTTMENKRSQTLATEIFKTINNINPSYIFTPKTNAKI